MKVNWLKWDRLNLIIHNYVYDYQNWYLFLVIIINELLLELAFNDAEHYVWDVWDETTITKFIIWT